MFAARGGATVRSRGELDELGRSRCRRAGFRSLATAYPSYSGPLLNLGILHAKAGKLDEAEKAIRDAIARNGNNAAAFNQLGIVQRKQGEFKDASDAYTRAVQIDPNYALAWLNLGVLCDLYLQEPQRAGSYERYLATTASPDAKVMAGSPSSRNGSAPSREVPKLPNEHTDDHRVSHCL